MARDAGVEPVGQGDERVDALDMISELANLPPGTLLTLNGMAQIFGKSPNTIMRAVAEGRLPKPFRIFSQHCWRVGEVDAFLQKRMRDAQQVAVEHPGAADPEVGPTHLKPLRKGASPIRSEHHAGNT